MTCEQKLPRQHPRYKGGNALHFDKFVEHIYQPRNMRRMIQHYPPLSASRMDRRRERARKLLGLPSLLLQPVLHTLSTIIWQALQFIINFICISINRAFLLLVYIPCVSFAVRPPKCASSCSLSLNYASILADAASRWARSFSRAPTSQPFSINFRVD